MIEAYSGGILWKLLLLVEERSERPFVVLSLLKTTMLFWSKKDESVLNHITKRFDIIGILGNGANFKILEQADVEDCDIFISMTEYDEVNMISAVLAKKMGAKETIVRVRNPEYSNSYFKEKKISWASP